MKKRKKKKKEKKEKEKKRKRKKEGKNGYHRCSHTKTSKIVNIPSVWECVLFIIIIWVICTYVH
jgi:hypothetical protein